MKTTIKKTHKIVSAVLAVCALSTSMFVGCGNAGTNEKPEIDGVTDFNCIAGEPVDLLSRVAALDKEDGDITPAMKISVSPEVQVKDGFATFTETGDYTITYSVTDSDGNTVTEESFVSVYERSVYKDFDLVDMNGFSLDIGGGAKLDSKSVVGDGDKSRLLFKASGATADADVALSRTYALEKGREYTFKYTFKSNVAGTAKVKLDDGAAADIAVVKGDNEITFTRDLTAAEKDQVEVKVQLMLGGLGGDIDIEFVKAEASYVGIRDSKISLTAGKNVHDRLDGTEGSVVVSDDKKSAALSITKAAAEDWRGGMFINTGFNLIAGAEYTVKFNVTAANENKYGVIVQNRQWDERKYKTVSVEKEGLTEQEIKFTPTAEDIANKNELWLYVMSGDKVNEITISDIEVTRGELQHETFDIELVKVEKPTPPVVSDDAITFEKVEGRFDKADNAGGANLEGTATASEDNKSATLHITGAGNASWAGGMFINLGVTLEADKEYTLSFDVTTETANHFAVIAQNNQWSEDRYQFINFNLNADEQRVLTNEHKEVKFTPTAANIEKSDGLWLYVEAGDRLNKITISNVKVTSDEQAAAVSVYATDASNVIDRFDGTKGTVETSEDKKSATLKITEASEEDWRGGMFVNTGLTLASGVKYKVSFDATAGNASKYDVIVQNRQWDGVSYGSVSVEQAGLAHKEVTFTPAVEDIENKNELWLYVQSGKSVNEITLSNLKVEVLGDDEEYDSDTVTITETFTCRNVYKMFAYQGADNYAEWKDGKLVFNVEKFGTTDWHNKIEGPNFDFGTGEFGDYYISFKAKATAPVKVVVVCPKSGAWDPNLVWADITLTDTETLYTLKSNALDTPATHHFEFQFGWAVNGEYEDVTIEISDIKISYKSFID